MPPFFPVISEGVEPTFKIDEKDFNMVADLNQGQRIQAMINYTVIEKTKNFAVIRIDFIQMAPSRRKT